MTRLRDWRWKAALGAGFAAACLAPWACALDPRRQNLLEILAGPSLAYPLGTDHLGRDVLARILHGAPLSLGIALICVGIGASLGVLLGVVAAARGGWTDALIMRLADLTLAFPGVLLALLLAGLMGGGLAPLLLALLLTIWPQFARMARSVALGAWLEPHVEASRLAGLPLRLILWRQILPEALRHTAALAAFAVGGAILTISALGFLGLGLQPPTPEWGAMVTELLPHLHEAPLQIAAPCLAIFCAVGFFMRQGSRLVARLAPPESRA